MQFSDAIWWRHNKSKMADGRHIENRFWLYLGAILADQREIWNRDEGLHDNRSHDQNCNFRKFKMADGRHFENSFISISQPWIIRFWLNSVHRYNFPFQACRFDKKSTFFKLKMADGRHIENRFWLYLGAILPDQREIWNRDEGLHADIGHVTKSAIFANSRWRTAAILKIALSPYLSGELSDFDQIW